MKEQAFPSSMATNFIKLQKKTVFQCIHVQCEFCKAGCTVFITNIAQKIQHADNKYVLAMYTVCSCFQSPFVCCCFFSGLLGWTRWSTYHHPWTHTCVENQICGSGPCNQGQCICCFRVRTTFS